MKKSKQWHLFITSRIWSLRPKRAYVFTLFYLYNSSIFLFHGLLLWSPSYKATYGHSTDNVCERVSGYALGLTVFVLSEYYNVCFYSYCHFVTVQPMHNWQGGLFPLNGLNLSTSLISGEQLSPNVTLYSYCSWNQSLILQKILFYDLPQARIASNSFNWLFRCLNTG